MAVKVKRVVLPLNNSKFPFNIFFSVGCAFHFIEGFWTNTCRGNYKKVTLGKERLPGNFLCFGLPIPVSGSAFHVQWRVRFYPPCSITPHIKSRYDTVKNRIHNSNRTWHSWKKVTWISFHKWIRLDIEFLKNRSLVPREVFSV